MTQIQTPEQASATPEQNFPGLFEGLPDGNILLELVKAQAEADPARVRELENLHQVELSNEIGNVGERLVKLVQRDPRSQEIRPETGWGSRLDLITFQLAEDRPPLIVVTQMPHDHEYGPQASLIFSYADEESARTASQAEPRAKLSGYDYRIYAEYIPQANYDASHAASIKMSFNRMRRTIQNALLIDAMTAQLQSQHAS